MTATSEIPAAAPDPSSEPPPSVSPHPVMVTITLLMVIGVVMVYSALAGMEGPAEGTPWYKLTSFRSMMFAPAAFVVMLLVSRLPYRKLDSRFIWVLAAACVVLLLCVYIPGIGVEKNFRRRWIKVPGVPDEFNLGFQPSELVKFGLVVFLAWWLGRRKAEPESFTRGFLPAAAALTVIAGLIAKEDLGTGIIVVSVGFAMLFVGGCRWWHPMLVVPVAVAVLWVSMDATRWNRLMRQFTEHRELDTMGKDYQVWNSMLAIASGGVHGQGLGEGIQKLGRLPLKSSDFIFAHITEELGLVGGAVILSFFGLLLYQGGLIMTRATDRFGQLIAFGITFIFGMQAFIHAGVVTKVLPNKGINLPFISAGGTGLIIMAAAGGLLAAVARGSGGARGFPVAGRADAAAAGNAAGSAAVDGARQPVEAAPRPAGIVAARPNRTPRREAGDVFAAYPVVAEPVPAPDLPAANIPAPAGGRRSFDRARLAKLLGS